MTRVLASPNASVEPGTQDVDSVEPEISRYRRGACVSDVFSDVVCFILPQANLSSRRALSSKLFVRVIGSCLMSSI